MANASLKALVAGSLLLASCAAHRATHFWAGPSGLTAQRLDDVLRANPLPAAQNIGIVNLGAMENSSHHVVQVRGAEALHIHATHDLTAYIHRGTGIMQVGAESFRVRQGDWLFVPRGIPHAFRNTGPEIAAAVAVFSPAFDGTDTLPVPEP
jgi:mannose-6-phosphate isomerase-like protein (cupin superfamily)